MSMAEAVFLGIIQGLTEFLPVSSSGHLVLVQHWLGVKAPGITFEIMVHLGTLLAVLAVYGRDLMRVALCFLKGVMALAGGRITWSAFWDDQDSRLGLLLVAGTVPAALLGLAFEPFFASLFASPMVVAYALVLTGVVLWVAGRLGESRRGLEGLTLADALLVGFFQAAAIAPGISRSGATIAAGLFRGLNREAAARFSFLLSIPAIMGAVVLGVVDLANAGPAGLPWNRLIAGTVAAAVSGFVAIRTLLRLLRAGRLSAFSWYVWALAVTVMVWQKLMG